MDEAKSSLKRGAEILCVLGALKNRCDQGEDVKSGYRTKGLIT